MSGGPVPNSDRLELEQVGTARARRIVLGDLTGIRTAKGWPHDDTITALTMAANASREEDTGWLIRRYGEVIGDIGVIGPVSDLADPATPPREVEIGYGLAAPQRGCGYATEAVALLVAWLLAQPGTGAVIAFTAPGNTASMAVLARNDFTEMPSPDPSQRAWRRGR